MKDRLPINQVIPCIQSLVGWSGATYKNAPWLRLTVVLSKWRLNMFLIVQFTDIDQNVIVEINSGMPIKYIDSDFGRLESFLIRVFDTETK